MKRSLHTRSDLARWRRSSLELLSSEVVAGSGPGPKPPSAWASRLSRLIDASRQPEPGPAWWTPVDAYFGSVETRMPPHPYYLDGMKRLGRRDPPLVFFQFTLAGFGNFEEYGFQPQPIPPGKAFFAVLPSRHSYYLPAESPGWTFGWLGLYHPYLVRRIAKCVSTSGAVLDTPPGSPLIACAMRLVRGAFRKDFRDRFEVERELFDFTLAFERQVEQVRSSEAEQLLERVRRRLAADPAAPLSVDQLASDHGMSRSAFSHFFRAQTGLTPAHHVTELRVQRAARLLTSTPAPLAQIAEQCGFANANHFCKVFRRFRQQSPSVYRRSVG